MKTAAHSADWHRLAPFLDRALDLEGVGRDAWLVDLSTTQPQIAQSVRDLLARHARLDSEGFLAHSVALTLSTTLRTGQNVGAYTLDRLLGRGGMGEVWLATRSDGRYEGQCAIKFLNATTSAKLAERFRHEGSFLARLTHPNIARLFDAGTVDDQQYLALEYVDGIRIDRYCDERSLNIEQRVRLFIDVVAAVAHAHSHLIIHRDLKPTNVLVTKDGQIKLLDFGIAKLLAGDVTESADLTRIEDTALTPEYAAPEQLLGDAPSTGTDVYQLGLLLYVLLTGQHPTSHAGTRGERIRAALDGVVPAASEVAHRSLRGTLRGDLDAILAMALRKIPSERYSTAQSLKEDLQRYLNREPIAARRGAGLYRFRKFVGRHRFATTGSILAVTALVAAALIAYGQAREAARQRDAARMELARATAVNDFATYLVSAASPGDGRFTASELLAASEALIDKQFPTDDPIKAEILAMVGAQYLVAQRFDKAAPVLKRAAAIAKPFGNPALNARINCPLAIVTLALDGQPKERQVLIEASLAALPATEEYAQLRAECLTHLSEFGFFTNNAVQTIDSATAALKLLDSAASQSVLRRIDAQAALAWGHYLAHENEKADREFAWVAHALESAGRGMTLAAADNYNNWALVHFRGDIRKAEPLSRRALELRRSIEGTGGVAPNITANQAGTLLLLGRFDEAAELFEETIRTSAVRGDKITQIYAMMEFADLRIQTKQLSAAKRLLDQAAELATDPRIGRSPKAILAYHQGLLEEAYGNWTGARTRYAESRDFFENVKSKIALVVSLHCGIARSELALGNSEAAVKSANDALELAKQLADPNAPSYLIGKALLVTGDNQQRAGKPESRQTYRLAHDNLEKTLGSDHLLTKEAARKSAGG